MGRVILIPVAAFRDAWGHFEPVLLGCLLAMLVSLPVIAVVAFVAAALRSYWVLALGIALGIVVLPFPGPAGLQLMFNDIVHREALAGEGELMEGLRRYAVPALRAWLLAVPVTLVLILNLVFYAQHRLPISPGMILLTGLVLLVWLGINFLVYPVLMEQEEPRVLLAYRNAALMVLARPLAIALLLPIWLLLVLVMSATGLIGVFGLAWCAGIQQYTVHTLLGTFDVRGEAGEA